jgi:hypothetical protein
VLAAYVIVAGTDLEHVSPGARAPDPAVLSSVPHLRCGTCGELEWITLPMMRRDAAQPGWARPLPRGRRARRCAPPRAPTEGLQGP